VNGVRAFGAESGAYQSGWDEGYAAGCRQASTAERTAAFGAIRRAAIVARRNDEEAHKHGVIWRRMVDDDPKCIFADHNKTCTGHRRSQAAHRQRAESIRFAIRAAIQSPWLMIEPGMSRRDP
jgi:hypothetical protein